MILSFPLSLFDTDKLGRGCSPQKYSKKLVMSIKTARAFSTSHEREQRFGAKPWLPMSHAALRIRINNGG